MRDIDRGSAYHFSNTISPRKIFPDIRRDAFPTFPPLLNEPSNDKNATDSEETLDCSTEEDALSLKSKTVKGKTVPEEVAQGEMATDNDAGEMSQDVAERGCHSPDSMSQRLHNPADVKCVPELSPVADVSLGELVEKAPGNEDLRDDEQDGEGREGEPIPEGNAEKGESTQIASEGQTQMAGTSEAILATAEENQSTPFLQRGTRTRRPLILSDFGPWRFKIRGQM